MSARQETIDRYRHFRTIANITVAGPLLTEKTSLILYVFRTCPARIRPGKRHELPIKKYNVTHNYFQIGWCNCNAKQHLSGALKHLSRTAIKEAARRVGLWSRDMLVMDNPDEMDLVFDVAVFDTKSGQSRALDRYARAHPAAPGSDEALTLDALQHSRFHIIRVVRRHEIAGLATEDTVSHEQLWLMDEGLEVTARSGMGLATRLLRVNGFYMTTGAAVPVTTDVLKEAISSRPAWQNENPSRFVNDPRFPEAVYAAAIRQGKMQFMQFRNPK